MKKEFDTRYVPDNELVKYRFFEELEHTRDGYDPKTVNQFVNALHEFEVANNFKDFRKYDSDWAIAFKDYLNDKTNKQTGDNISKSMYLHYISHARRFFEWLVKNDKEYSKIKAKDIEFLNVGRGEKNKAKAIGYQPSHDVADILATIRKMPAKTPMEKRNKAIMSLFLLTTPRIGALQQARIGSIQYFKEYDAWAFVQDPRLQNTKYSKGIIAFFIGQSDDVTKNVLEWRDYLIAEGFKDKDYLFPKITPSFTKDGKSVMQLTKGYMKSDSQIRDIVKKAYEANNLPYIRPHSFRHSITRMIRKEPNATDLCIALAQNAGQKNGMATLITSYGGDYLERQANLMKTICLE